jgi:hypothetical protein
MLSSKRDDTTKRILFLRQAAFNHHDDGSNFPHSLDGLKVVSEYDFNVTIFAHLLLRGFSFSSASSAGRLAVARSFMLSVPR